MQSKLLAALVLTALACSDSKGPLDPASTTAAVQQRYGAPVGVGGCLDEAVLVGTGDQGSGGPGGPYTVPHSGDVGSHMLMGR